MSKYLDYEGLLVLWTKIKNKINEGIVASDAMIFKGTIGTGGTVTELPSTTAKTGWTYKVITAGTYSGSKCEIGDMLICLTDGSASAAATWTVVQANIDGAVTGPASSTASHVAVFNDATGKVIKDSGYTIATSVPSGAVFTDTKYSAGAGISLSGTTFSNSGVRSVKAGTSANQVVVDTNGTNSTITINNVANATNATKATKDSSDLLINTTYIKGATASGNILTLTKGDNNTVNVTLPLASSTTNGAMSSADKSKLDGIADGAQANLNSFSNIKVGTSTIASESATDTFELAQGSNVTISADAATKKVTIAAKDTTYKAATASTDGLMTAADKAKLDGIAAGANAYSHPAGSAASKEEGLYKISTDAQSHVASVTAVKKEDITALGIPAQDTTYPLASSSANGLMSKSDKAKLDTISAHADISQNAFSRVTVGDINIDAKHKTSVLELAAGSNVTITPDATNDKITIAATNTDTLVQQLLPDAESPGAYNILLGLNPTNAVELGAVNKAPGLVYQPNTATIVIENPTLNTSTSFIKYDTIRTLKSNTSSSVSMLSDGSINIEGPTEEKLSIDYNGITLFNIGSSSKVFASDGSLMEIQAITTAEINALS